jgi:hypothetical protein
MKRHTDLEQSKKLAEILPFESADMHYNNGSCRGVDYTEHFSAELMSYQEALHLMKIHKTNFMFQVIPCWSIAALINIIPQELFNGKYIINITEGLADKWIITYDHYENRNHSYYGLSTCADNLVDACVAMIEKLYKLKIL